MKLMLSLLLEKRKGNHFRKMMSELQQLTADIDQMNINNSLAARIAIALGAMRMLVECICFAAYAYLLNHKIISSSTAADKKYFLLDLLLPPDLAEERIASFHHRFETVWLKQYGPRTAKLIFYFQTVFTIFSYYRSELLLLVSAWFVKP